MIYELGFEICDLRFLTCDLALPIRILERIAGEFKPGICNLKIINHQS